METSEEKQIGTKDEITSNVEQPIKDDPNEIESLKSVDDEVKPQSEPEEKPAQQSSFKTPEFISPISLPVKPKVSAKTVTVSNIEPSGSKPKNDSKLSKLSPAERLKHSQTSIPYKEPAWGGLCSDSYKLEVLKNGTIIDNLDLTEKSFYVFGRLPSCDVSMEHPSLSRHHAIIQYCGQKTDKHDVGWYLYDLDSTHGTWINKNKIHPRIYNRIRVGHVIKFGGSSRLYILQGPDEDQDDESELSVTEIKLQRAKQKAQAELLKQADIENMESAKQKVQQETTCSWGMDDEPEESEDPDDVNPFAMTEESELNFDDPKKELKKYFEREGYDMPEYEFVAAGFGKQHCRIELPIDTANGQPMIAEALVSAKKKEAVVACAMEALKILDRAGELRKSSHESRKRKKKNWEEDDFYDSDEDTFLDRTGVIEQKRLERMKKAGKDSNAVETYDSLVEKLKEIESEMLEINKKLDEAKQATLESDDIDDLDAYMSSLKSGAMDKRTRMKLKSQLYELKQQEQKLRKLANIAKPASLPELKRQEPVEKKLSTGDVQQKKQLPMIGKKLKGPTTKSLNIKPALASEFHPTDDCDVEEEEEEDCDPQDDKQTKITETNKKTNSGSNNSDKSGQKQYGLVTKVDNSLPKVSDPSEQCDKTSSGKIVSRENSTTGEIKNKDSKVSNLDSQDNLSTIQETKRKSQSSMKFQNTKKQKTNVSYSTDDPNYAVWMPPKDQTGDGKTKLNEKYGY